MVTFKGVDPAASIIGMLGGQAFVARHIGVSRQAVWLWTKGANAGAIPEPYRDNVMNLIKQAGLPIGPEELALTCMDPWPGKQRCKDLMLQRDPCGYIVSLLGGATTVAKWLNIKRQAVYFWGRDGEIPMRHVRGLLDLAEKQGVSDVVRPLIVDMVNKVGAAKIAKIQSRMLSITEEISS
jgi:hypothetical protein